MEWEKRNSVGSDRVEELREMYESMGFEVRIERFKGPEQTSETCGTCYGDPAGEYFVLYTRVKKS